ncbi:tRNA (adenosine(37)-N6)-dimethylallyltransferase MiaA [Hydrogenimonas sp.]
MKTVAILGPTASGKTELSLRLAKESGSVILSLDSLAIYRTIDIASAKPTPAEREGIVHFGIDCIDVDTPFNVSVYIELYKEARRYAEAQGCALIIVGGTGFYLKMLMEGISELPPIDAETAERVSRMVEDPAAAHRLLASVDEAYAASIPPSDRYRIEKGLSIWYQTATPPSRYFREHPPTPLLESVELFEIAMARETLNERIGRRTRRMFEEGLVDEVASLEFAYGRNHPPMRAIGIREVLDYFDGKADLTETKERVAIHTRQLAKRQRTFNRTQFPPHPLLEPSLLYERVRRLLER